MRVTVELQFDDSKSFCEEQDSTAPACEMPAATNACCNEVRVLP